MKKIFVGVLLLVFVSVVPSSKGICGSDIPLPEDIEIVAPASTLPPEIAAFCGQWQWTGNWERKLEAILIVGQINEEEAKVIYAWGNSPAYKIDAGYVRQMAKVVGKNSIEFGGEEGRPKFVFKMTKGLDKIKGSREFRGYCSTVTMKKQNLRVTK